jgi:hypothetical protein
MSVVYTSDMAVNADKELTLADAMAAAGIKTPEPEIGAQNEERDGVPRDHDSVPTGSLRIGDALKFLHRR